MKRSRIKTFEQAPEGPKTLSVNKDIEPHSFPIASMPSKIRQLILEIANVTQTPAELASLCALAFAAGALGKGARMLTKESRRTPGNLMIAIGAPTGTGKSSVFDYLNKPIQKIQEEEQANWDSLKKPEIDANLYFLDLEIRKASKILSLQTSSFSEASNAQLKIKAAEKTKALLLNELKKRPRYVIEDCSNQQAEVIIANQTDNTILSASADAREVINNLLGRLSKEGHTGENLWLKLYSWEALVTDRITREAVSAKETCGSAIWLVQPDLITKLFSHEKMLDSGLVPRLLACNIHCDAGFIEYDAPGVPDSLTEDWEKLIRTLVAGRSKRITLTVSKSARVLMENWEKRWIDARNRGGEFYDIHGVVARWSENTWRIAVVLHLIEFPNAADGDEVSEETIEAAISIAKWMISRQLIIIEDGRRKKQVSELTVIKEVIAKFPNGITAREFMQQKKSMVNNNAKEATALLERHVSQGALQRVENKPDGGGHTEVRYKLKQ